MLKVQYALPYIFKCSIKPTQFTVNNEILQILQSRATRKRKARYRENLDTAELFLFTSSGVILDL